MLLISRNSGLARKIAADGQNQAAGSSGCSRFAQAQKIAASPMSVAQVRMRRLKRFQPKIVPIRRKSQACSGGWSK